MTGVPRPPLLALMAFHTFRSQLCETYFESYACPVNLRLSLVMFIMYKLYFEHKYGLGKLKLDETRFSGGVSFPFLSFIGIQRPKTCKHRTNPQAYNNGS